MDIDGRGESSRTNAGGNENGSHFFPVLANEFGEGLPYAPVDWPNPGDKWLWRVGSKVAASGFYQERYLYLPRSLHGSVGKKKRFASKLLVQEYIRKTFPNADIDAFFASFSWKIPANDKCDLLGDLPMEINKTNGGKRGVNENEFHLFPVSANESGEGLPYAPVDWPNPGDKWLWRVGNRVTSTGFFGDRYLYLPASLNRSLGKRTRFSSKPSLQEYIKTRFPDADVGAFFDSFSWKVPAKDDNNIIFVKDKRRRKGEVPLEIDKAGESQGEKAGINEYGSRLFPVSVNESGEGLPYAPVDWPKPGDKWLWRVGYGIGASGFFLDRYLYPPNSLHKSKGKRKLFRSKTSVQQYIQGICPNVDVDAFFASFSWKIPAKDKHVLKGCEGGSKCTIVSSEEIAEQSDPDVIIEGMSCKAKNKLCTSLLEPQTNTLQRMACDKCCSYPDFCRDCCCIVCNKHVSYAYGGYSFIKCEAAMTDGTICGHVAHIDCALGCSVGGTVGATMSLDAEYYCNRCDNTRDFIPHVTKLMQTCESIESREDIGKVLNVGSYILRCSHTLIAKKLLRRIEVAMEKLKDGARLADIWKVEDVSSDTPGHVINEMENENYQGYASFGEGSSQVSSGNFDLQFESFKLEDEVDQILHALREAQKTEYRIADDTINAQKNCLLNLYKQLEYQRLKVYSSTSKESYERSVGAVRETEDQIKREVKKLRDMKQVAKGFGMTSKGVLQQYFGIKTDH